MSCYLEYLDYLRANPPEDERPLGDPIPELHQSGLRAEAQQCLNVDLPDAYLEFLSHADGFNYNGVFFFSSGQDSTLPGLIHENEQLRATHHLFAEHLVLGQSGVWYYAYHPATQTYRALQAAAVSEAHYRFEDFDDCVSSASGGGLELVEDDQAA